MSTVTLGKKFTKSGKIPMVLSPQQATLVDDAIKGWMDHSINYGNELRDEEKIVKEMIKGGEIAMKADSSTMRVLLTSKNMLRVICALYYHIHTRLEMGITPGRSLTLLRKLCKQCGGTVEDYENEDMGSVEHR